MASTLAQRVPREGGTQTRAYILDAAVKLFLKKGYDGVSVSEIATAAEAFPNQVTYHFGGKEPLFVEAASRAMLRAAKHAENITRVSETAEIHTRLLLDDLLGPGSTAVMMFAEAMLLARRKPELRVTIVETMRQLNDAGEAAMVDTLRRGGWETRATPGVITRSFWAAIFGLALEKAALGHHFEEESSEAVAFILTSLSMAFVSTDAEPTTGEPVSVKRPAQSRVKR